MAGSTEHDRYLKTLEGLNYVCLQAVPCIQSTVQNWHAHQKTTNGLQPCLSASCPTKGKPTRAKGACPNCILWGTAIESVYFPPTGKTGIQWQNLNPRLLGHDAIEVSKAFVLRLPHGANPKTFTDYDPASVLKIMMGFGEFHNHTKGHYDVISKVSFGFIPKISLKWRAL